MTSQADFEAFIASIPNVTKVGHSDLRECVADSAKTNAGDTPNADFWSVALDTAKFIADDWRSYYPDLI